MAKTKFVIKRNGSKVPFRQDRVTNAIYRAAVSMGGRDKTIAQGLSDQVVVIIDANFGNDKIPTVEEIQDIVEKVLIENGHAKVAKAYILYRDERNRKRRQEKSFSDRYNDANIPWAKLWSVLDWAVEHDVNTIEKLNKRIKQGECQEIVIDAELAYQQDLDVAVSSIINKKNEVKLVIVAGPSSSGKTTTTKKIAGKLEERNLTINELNLDNYYFDLELHPKDEFGDFDFETPQALDMDLINLHIRQLLDGKEIKVPYYDFKTGKRTLDASPMQINENCILLIDSLYGLYPPLTEGVKSRPFRVYIEPLLQLKDLNSNYISWTDIRLMRRMLRDARHRGYDYERTLTHWHYVRAGELRNIIPYIQSADVIVNSGMPYELSIYRPQLLEYFKIWSQKYKNDPLRQDAYTRAKRIHILLESILPINDETIVPRESVLREFIGGLIL